MSISHKELMALRRAHLQEKERQQQSQPPTVSRTPAPPSSAPSTALGGGVSPTRQFSSTVPAVSRGAVSGGELGGLSPTRHAAPRPASVGHSVGAIHPSVAISIYTTSIATNPRNFSAVDKLRDVSAKNIQPKVMAPTSTVRGHVPKPELLRRRRILYDSVDVESLLGEKGIDYFRDGVGGSASSGGADDQHQQLMPLEAFDDFEFDEMSPADWMSLGLDISDGDPKQKGLPAVAVREEQKRGRWVPATVVAWDDAEHKLLVEFGGDRPQKVWLPRIHVCLKAEDPTRFVERVLSAHERRKKAFENIRHKLYVESMPVDNAQVIGNLTAERIRELAINTDTLLRNEDNLDIQSLIKEVNDDFALATNEQLFAEVTKNNSAVAQLFQGSAATSAAPTAPSSYTDAKPAREFGQVQLPEQNIGKVVRAFHSNTYLNNQNEVLLALHRVRDECDSVLKTNVFVISPEINNSRPLMLKDFEDLQSTAIAQRHLHLKETWCVNIREHIRDSLAETTESDAVNLNIASKEAYEGSKLQRLMTTIKYQLQDTLFHLITASSERYVQFIEECCNHSVQIDGVSNAEVSKGPLVIQPRRHGHDIRPPTGPTDVAFPIPPLFKVELQMDPSSEDKVSYKTDIDDFVKNVVIGLNKGITTMQQIPQIEPQVLDFIYNTDAPMIQSLSANHPWAAEWRDRLSIAVEHATQPLREYVKTYESFKDLISLEVDAYVRECDATIQGVKGLEKEAQKHIERERQVLATIPTSVNLGTFHVDCVEFRKKCAEKCMLLAQKVLELMAKRARAKAETIDEKFSAIRATIIRPLETPEDCVKAKEFIKTIPDHLYDLNALIAEMREVDDAMDRYEFALSDDDFAKKWRAIGWPSRLDDEILRKNQDIEQTKRSLTDGIEKSQVVFAKEVDKLQKTVAGFYKRTDIKKVSEIAGEVQSILQDIRKCRDQAALFNTHEGLFDREKTDYSHVHQLEKDFEAYALLWNTANDWLQWHSSWTNDPFESIDSEKMTENVTAALKNMQKCCKEPKFKDKAPILRIAEDVRAQIEEFKPVLPVVRYLRQQGMKERHWNQISRELGFEVRPGVTLLTLQDVYSLDLEMHEAAIMKVSEVAAREYDIETSLTNMKKEWNNVEMKVRPHRQTGCFVIPKDSFDSTQEILDNHLLLTQGISFSPFKKNFEAEIEEWEKSLKLIQAIFDEWKVTQKAWLYLEPIFQSEDIARQLPAENKRFQTVNKNWKFLTNRANEINLTMPFCTQTEDCLKMFIENNALLDLVQKGLEQYLENKRSSFARFYFLANDVLLLILSEAKDPQKIQPHFQKLFEAVYRIDMRSPDNEMFGMISDKDEYIAFSEPVLPRKNVENWLSEIENMMKRSIRMELKKGMERFAQMDRREFFLNTANQVALAVNQIYWTAECEKYLNKERSLKNYAPIAGKNLMMMVETVRQKLTPLQRTNMSALITIEVHARDIVDKLAEEGVDNVLAFEWVSQLRSYWEDDDCFSRQVEATFRYGGESLGNTSRLVITPLTDRIYLTLTGAMHMFLGGAPAGPAGTGKTETVKDLAKAVAKQCVVFNCQEGMTYASMGKFFKGLANAGAWACFDEFNRIDVEVLSVVAQQVGSLQEAARSGQYRIPFEGTEIVVDPTYAVYITMNPGYAGRTELPDNLKVLFRPVACMVPDYAMIAEIRLFSYGYADSRKLAQKIVATSNLSSEQLSSQDHYDFGMRSVNTVISAAGMMKREHPDDPEDMLLLRALKDANAPKFLRDDLQLFSGIISDLFPGVTLPPANYGNFQSVLVECTLAENLQPTELFLKKCVEVYEMSILRHGQMSVGPTMGGKSSVTRVLKAAMGKLRLEHGEERFAPVDAYYLNPKSVTMSQLYGGFDEATGEWRDGLIGELFRVAASQDSGNRQWIVFDGPVDALWIESMNTVLDENKKLCLISSEIILMTQYMNVMFEVEDLAVASPATVSRAGMIYMEPTHCIGVDSFITSWLNTLPKICFAPYLQNLQKVSEMLFAPLITFVQTSVNEYVTSTWPNLMQSCFRIYNAFLDPFTTRPGEELAADKAELLREVHMPLLIFAITWSFGVTGDSNSRKKFDRFLRDQIRNNSLQILVPEFGLLHDFEFVVDEKRWVAWQERAPSFNAMVNASNFSEMIVPTTDVVRYTYINKLLLSKCLHTLCIGPTGTGKSVVLTQLLMTAMPAEFMPPIFFTFSARTSANQTQDLIFSKFEARKRTSPQIWGPPVSKKFVVFIDDVNMPLLEEYGAQPPVELLRQYLDYKGWYDRKAREFFNIVDIVLTGAMGPPGGGRNKVTSRFSRHFNQIAFPDVDDENMNVIFNSLTESYFKNFTEDVRSKVSSVIASAIESYNTIIKELRPTTSRPHYLFNLRDLAKVVSGLLMADSRLVTTEVALSKLYIHEASRTFRDRLVDDPDREWFDQLMQKQLQKHFKLKWSEVVTQERLLFADFVKGNSGDASAYEEVKDIGRLVSTCERMLGEYNNLHRKQMNLVMFLDAVEHTCRIARVLKKPSGHMLLLGIGGSGRQSLARFAAFIDELETSQVEISKGYSMAAWREDLKTILRKVSINNKPTLFLITDTQIVNEGMLEDVNNLLNSGEVPNLFVGPDNDEIMTAMRPICVQEGIHLDKVNMYARFVKFCKSNLHVAVCMSPMGEPFRNRLRMFPALVNCCTIDWFSAWPSQALQSVAREFFKSLDTVKDEKLVDGCIDMCVHIHTSVEAMSKRFLAETNRHNYVTPTSYLEVLQCFRSLMESESKKLSTKKNRLQNGLAMLRRTEVQITELQKELAENQPILQQKQVEIQAMVAKMEEETKIAVVTRADAEAEEKVASVKQQECAKLERETQAILDEAMPALEQALEKLNELTVNKISEVAKYPTPPRGVLLTLKALCVMFGLTRPPQLVMKMNDQTGKREPDYQQTAKGELFSNVSALQTRMLNFHKKELSNVSENNLQQIKSMIEDSSNPFTPAAIKVNGSDACATMCEWAHAMVNYSKADKLIKPLKSDLEKASGERKEAEERLAAAQGRLQAAEAKLASLEAERQQKEAEKQKLEDDVALAELRLQRASVLTGGLAGEQKSWKATVAALTEREKYLTGDMLCAAGQISYVGAFTTVYRQALIEDWVEKLDRLGVLRSAKVSIYDTMQDAVQTRQWTINALPADNLSVENALILTHARRWPLMIDPQMQANRWIRQTYSGEAMEVIKPSGKDYIKRIEHCIRVGRAVLLENITDEIDPALDPLLTKQTFMQGGQEMIRISDTSIPWNKDFKFFMTTKLSNPHYIPEVMVKVTLLNFFITPAGLEDQLLGVLVGRERKELEDQKVHFVQQNAAMKAQLEDIQSTILRKLDEVKGNILDDEELINYLEKSRVTTAEIHEKVSEAEVTEREIDATREGYRSMAYHSSVLYFCCALLANVDPMYQYSLRWFVQLFESSIDAAERSDNLATRLESLKNYFTYNFYSNITRSLFEKHKLMFSFVLCVRILESENKIDASEWKFILQGPSEQLVKTPPNPAPQWLTDIVWKDICYLDARFPAFKGFGETIREQPGYFYDIFLSAKAHRSRLYGDWDTRLSSVQKMMFVRCLRPDKLMDAVQDFVTANLGERFIKPPQFDLETSYKDSTNLTPLIFILSPGADPFEDWKKFAETKSMSKKLSDISLGQGQGPRAKQLFEDGLDNGKWVLLQNCHLATSWMPELERLVEGMSSRSAINAQFRLWLTSMPSPFFPVAILQIGVKMTNEPPKGMKANVTRSVTAYSDHYMNKCKKPEVFKRLIFSMCFFHALIQERRKFGPLGWNISYEYTTGDLNCCVSQIGMFLDKYAEVPYRVIRELSGHIHYGGRVTDDWDRRTIMTILDTFVTPKILDNNYAFSPSGTFKSIEPVDQKTYLETIDSWPINVAPEAFGLHENADITCARNDAFETLATIVLLQGDAKSSSAGGKSPDDTVTELALSILSRIRAPFDIGAFQHKYPPRYEDSMSTVLVQEAIRFNRLLLEVRSSLQNIQLAIKGVVVMSKELDDIYKAMYNNIVPTAWANKAYPSLKPLAGWVTDLVERLKMIDVWYDKGHPKAYWVSGFFFPQAFLTGMLQNYARKHQVSIDTISTGFKWLNMRGEDVTEAPESGCYIYGMYIEGARIDPTTLKLTESHAKVLYETTPLLWLIPVVNRDKNISGVYRCPLYKTLRRAGTLSTTGHSTNYVTTVEVETEVDQAHWVKRGVAMVCALNY